MSFVYQGSQVRRSTETENKRAAGDIYCKVKTSIRDGKWFENIEAKNHTFDEVMNKFMKEHASKKAHKTQLRYGVSFKHLKPFFDGKTLADITPREISRYVDKRRSDGSSSSSINNERNTLSKAFNLAINQWEWCKENPCSKIPKERDTSRYERILATDEEARLIFHSKSYLHGQLPEIITVALHTGMRLGEILNMQWENINLFQKTITVTETKNKENRTIPMTNTIFEILAEKGKVQNISGWVFATSKGTKIRMRNMQREWYNTLEKAGITDFRFHDLRHTAASRMVQAGVDIYSVAKILGHKTLEITKRYAHHNVDSLRNAVAVLDKLSQFYHNQAFEHISEPQKSVLNT